MKILDTTLRDGSYAINFGFTSSDTATICARLESVGIELIEIGHGVGLGASEKGMGRAAETDESYLKAAAGALTKARFGMFCIPGIATLDHIDMAASHGMGFIRIGTEVDRVAESEPFIRRAKELGMYVSANFMKSYATPPQAFAECAARSRSFGADILAIVDSAGGMLAQEVKAYFEAVRDACDIPLAFHGHDNLGLSVSNSILALEMGAEIVDGSLQGMGRSAGNAPTELLVSVTQRLGYDVPIDLLGLLDVGAEYVRPLMRRQGLPSLDVVTGFAQFHSSFMGIIREYASKHEIDPRKLIIGVCAEDKVNAPPELVEAVAKRLSREQGQIFTARFGFDGYFGDEQTTRKVA